MNKQSAKLAVSPGGEKHQILTRLLCTDGYDAQICEEKDACGATFYITPSAFDRDGLLKRGITPIEYLTRQDFKESNGILTAEAAIAEAILHTPFALASSRVLVTGSGCISQPLAHMLKALGADVTIAARSSAARSKARLMGYKAYDLCLMGGDYDIVFNTVPAMIFDQDALCSLNTDATIIDLASLPGGVDKEAADRLGIKVVPALALPGKYMPETAAKIIRASVRAAIKEMTL